MKKFELIIFILCLQARIGSTNFRSVLLNRNSAVVTPQKTAVNLIDVSGCKFTCRGLDCEVLGSADKQSLCRAIHHFLGEKLFYFQTKESETSTIFCKYNS